MNRILKRILLLFNRSRGMKYGVVAVLGAILVGFVGENSVWSHFLNCRKIAAMQIEIKNYRSIYEHDMRQLRRLDTNPKEIEKIARERYFMKADDEDIFVLSDDEPDTQTNPADETTE